MPTVTIKPIDRRKKPRQAAAFETQTDGLVVTRAWFAVPGYARWWTITHAASGCNIPAYFPNPDQAISAANDLADLTDWTAPEPERGPHFSTRVRSAMARHGAVDRDDLEPDTVTDTPLARCLTNSDALVTITYTPDTRAITLTCHGVDCGWQQAVPVPTLTGREAPRKVHDHVDPHLPDCMDLVRAHTATCQAPAGTNHQAVTR